jgi:integrase
MAKRRFGRVRQLASGRWQARYPGPDGIDRPADRTFSSKRDAERWLSLKEAEIVRGEWMDPAAGAVAFKDFATDWLRDRTLRPKTRQLYEGLLRLHILPTFQSMTVAEIRDRHVRRWHKELLDNGPGEITVAKAYRLLRTILNTAVEDELIRRNPCRIKGAGIERSAERPVLTVAQVFDLAESIEPRFRALILLAVFANMRWGELAALRRHCVDLDARTILIEVSLVELKDGSLVIGGPKTAAGRRRVVIPAVVVDVLGHHLGLYAQKSPNGLVFVGPKGGQLRRSNFSRQWRKAITKAELSGYHFHDLRHTGNTLASQTGATLRDLMGRMGHGSNRAAMIYLHTSGERDRKLAEALDALVVDELKRRPGRSQEDRSGTQRAQPPE